ncbi:MAG: Oligopeptide transporter, periplasmic oligopeptide-binding protein OppA [Devosia sp.]|uniref:ABC transporter substrate-binding protein n=1 Tax=Devosia sp. TaxID=1871048 RepID=UPI002631FA78|nr:ABC transporter substrate-binding protein [Devosia sp.]MDB5531373.1 Oligopeptide transporter, periplasmic oligopeptide-binding protein OppA [Devosia sp.]
MIELKTNSGAPLHRDVADLCERVRSGAIDRRGFLRATAWLGVSMASAGAFLGMGEPAFAQDEAPVDGGTLRFACQIQELTDPMLTSWIEASNLFRNSLEFLTYVDANNVTHPYLAKSWTPSGDLKVWDFDLDERATWSNGDALTPEDVIFNIQRWIAPESQSSNKTAFAAIESVEKTGDHSFRITLSRAVSSLPEQLYSYTCPILHRNFETDGANWPAKPVGTGPYGLVTYEVGRQATFKKRTDYWGTPAHLDEIHYIDLGTDITTHLAALASGQVDILYRTTIAEYDLMKSLPNVQVLSGRAANTLVMRMQVDQKPFDDIRVRQAVLLAADNQQMLDIAYRGEGDIAGNYHVSPTQADYFPLEPIPRDVAKAKALLAEAGYADGIDLEITLGNTQGKWEQDTAQVLQQNLAEAGIRLALNVLPASQYWPVWDKVPFGLTFWAHRPLGSMTLDLAYRSGGAWNESHFASPEFDAALDKAMAVVDPSERPKAMRGVETILRDAAVMVQAYWPSRFTAAAQTVRGFELHPADYFRMDGVWLAKA